MIFLGQKHFCCKNGRNIPHLVHLDALITNPSLILAYDVVWWREGVNTPGVGTGKNKQITPHLVLLSTLITNLKLILGYDCVLGGWDICYLRGVSWCTKCTLFF